MKHEVFLTYSTNDRVIAQAVCDFIEKEGIAVWMAPRDILPGSEWAASIIDAINSARAMVIVFSDHANKSVHIQREIERAINKRIPIIPFRIENVPPTPTLEYFISAPHWLDAFEPPVESHFEKLVKALRWHLNLVSKSRQQQTLKDAYSTTIGSSESLDQPPRIRRYKAVIISHPKEIISYILSIFIFVGLILSFIYKTLPADIQKELFDSIAPDSIFRTAPNPQPEVRVLMPEDPIKQIGSRKMPEDPTTTKAPSQQIGEHTAQDTKNVTSDVFQQGGGTSAVFQQGGGTSTAKEGAAVGATDNSNILNLDAGSKSNIETLNKEAKRFKRLSRVNSDKSSGAYGSHIRRAYCSAATVYTEFGNYSMTNYQAIRKANVQSSLEKKIKTDWMNHRTNRIIKNCDDCHTQQLIITFKALCPKFYTEAFGDNQPY